MSERSSSCCSNCFLRVSLFLYFYITIYILISYKELKKGYIPSFFNWNWNNWNASVMFTYFSSTKSHSILLYTSANKRDVFFVRMRIFTYLCADETSIVTY